MKKIIFVLCSITLITFAFIFYYDNKVTQDKLIIGVMDDKNINEYKEYINENKILQSSYEFSMIASDYDGIGDPFEYTLMNIENGLKNNKYDMLIGVDEDYLLPLIERNILYDLRDTLDKNNCNELILSFSKKHTEGSIYYIPSSIYNVKLLIINNDIFNELEIEIPTDQLTLKEFTDLCYLVDEKLHMCKKDNCFSVSLGSAVDEYLIDDINKLVLPLKDSQIKKELYIESYLTYAKLAKDLSYTRNDVGYQEPLDFTFLNGNIAMKLCTTYELYQFINYNPNFFDKDYRIKEFEYSILPIPYVNDDVNYTNAEIKVMCINKSSKHINECKDIVGFFLGKKHAQNTLDFKNPFVQNIISMPLYLDQEIKDQLLSTFKYCNIYYGNNLPTFYFIKNYSEYWSKIQEGKEKLDEYLVNQLSEDQYRTYLTTIY